MKVINEQINIDKLVFMEKIMIISDIIKHKKLGLILTGTFSSFGDEESSKLKKIKGHKIILKTITDENLYAEVIDISVSFSLTGAPLIGIKIKDNINIDDVKKGSIIYIQ